MKEVTATGVKFKRAGKIYEFLSQNFGEKVGDMIVVEAEKGEDLAQVVHPARTIKIDNKHDMKRVLRLATEKDLQTHEANKIEEAEALATCQKYANKHGLSMKLLLAEYCLDKVKLTFYYTADNRVDFRQLVKDLARIYRTRIEMRQIGVRDATKILGGFGLCGRELCCASFLRKFDNISIKTAKGQNGSMNPTKISGICGRLMCCLVYEKGCPGQNMVETGGQLVELSDIIVEKGSEGGEL
jgi:cell fate regulator YaaT (PSP1 superfamily)